MQSRLKRLRSDESGAIAPTFALSLFALVAVGGIAFDYARLAAMDTELQNAADQAALAAASQLDGLENATLRAENAALTLVSNDTLFANDGVDADADGSKLDVTVADVKFFSDREMTDEVARDDAETDDDADARFVQVTVGSRTAEYALTPVVGAFSGDSEAAAAAGLGSAICKVPPVMLCNPDEPVGNTNEELDFSPTRGVGLRLVTGNATVPGNFGWLESSIGNGANDLAAALGYDSPPGECQAITGVTTKTGMTASVLSAFNTRFDVFANGNPTCPSQAGGTCSPSRNTRKDLVCKSNSGTTCNNDNWSEAAVPYRPDDPVMWATTTKPYPSIMGYPKDLCHAVHAGEQTCGVKGNGTWDRDAYFRVNYGWMSQSEWTDSTNGTGLPANASRYDVYQWEMDNPSVSVGGTSRGINHPQLLSGQNAAFGSPATGRAGLTPGGTNVDRRRISVAVLNCRALEVKGKTTNVSVAKWLEVFLVEPAMSRSQGPTKWTDAKDIYVEVIGETEAGGTGDTAGQVVRRDVPYLIT